MGSEVAAVWCLAFIVGLLATSIPWGGVLVLGCELIAAIALPRLQPGKTLFTPKVWLIAGLIGLVAGFYLQARSPHPSAHDISRFVPNQKQEVTVYGQVEELPRLTRGGKSQFWLKVTSLKSVDQKVAGKLYVTLPRKDAIDLYPGKEIAVVGSLYKPKPAQNPGGFDFQKYLARQGSFAGFKGTKIQVEDFNQKPQWGWWMIRQRIMRSQAERLGEREGALLSAMVLGNRSVDIPFDIKDAFQRVGLSHALAASGFQVSLILAVILAATRRFSITVQVLCGATGLLIFGGLAGLQPAVSRALIMGFAVLVGIRFERKVKPLGSLLLAATILLVVEPTWIWDIGFQLSVLATLGLLVTVPALNKRLDWLPTNIVPAISVPIAAFIWTLPLQLKYFGITSPYSVIANIATTIFISIASIGGIISALFALISPVAGSFTAGLLYYPIHFLLAIVTFFCKLPGNSWAVGTISSWVMLALYGLICWLWIQPQMRRWWVGLVVLGTSLVLIPAWYNAATLFRVTAIAASTPILVIQDHGRVGLVNAGDKMTASLTVVPFLQKHGVNQIDWAVAVDASGDWDAIAEQIPIKALFDWSELEKPALDEPTIKKLEAQKGTYTQLGQEEQVQIGSISVRALSQTPTILQFGIGAQRWLWLKDVPNVQQRRVIGEDLHNHQVLWWSGRRLHPKLLEVVKPESAIVYSRIHSETLTQFQQNRISVYSTAQAGALQWTPSQGFKMSSEIEETDDTLL